LKNPSSSLGEFLKFDYGYGDSLFHCLGDVEGYFFSINLPLESEFYLV